MLEATLRDRAKRLLTASGRSDVPPFMVMDVMAAAARIEAAGGHVIHMEVGQPAAAAPKAAISAAHAALDRGRIDYTSALGIPSLRERIARHYREIYGCAVDAERIVVTTGSSGAFILAFLAMFEPGDRVAVTVPGYPPYRHILTALGCEPVLIETSSRNPPCADRRGLARRSPQDAAEGRAGRKPGQSHRHDDVARGAHQLISAAEGAGIRFISDEIYHGLDYAFPAVTRGGTFSACARHQFILEIFLHDRLAGRLDGGAGSAGAADRAAAAESRDLGADAVADRRRSRVRRPPGNGSRSSAAIRRTAAF